MKALALAARACFLDYRPGGMRVHAGSIILEPGLTEADLTDLVAPGLWLAKAGFGAFATPFDYAPLMSRPPDGDGDDHAHRRLLDFRIVGDMGRYVLASNPSVSFHVNGGPVAMPEAGFARLVNESDIALQLCTAGNLRTALLTAKLLDEAGQPERLLIATDTPTGSGSCRSACSTPSVTSRALAVCRRSRPSRRRPGNNARVYRLKLRDSRSPGKDADVVLIDACAGGSQPDALSALRNGDVPAVAAVFTDGVPRFVGRSRNTPASICNVARHALRATAGLFRGRSRNLEVEKRVCINLSVRIEIRKRLWAETNGTRTISGIIEDKAAAAQAGATGGADDFAA